MDILDYAVWVGSRRIKLVTGEYVEPLTPFALSAEELRRQRRSWMTSSSLMSVRLLVDQIERGKVPDSWIARRLRDAELDDSGTRSEMVARVFKHIGVDVPEEHQGDELDEPQEFTVDQRREEVARLSSELSIDDLAEYFGVSTRTIQRDLDAVTAAGEEE